jgi:uncharacterized DUF497 family protein
MEYEFRWTDWNREKVAKHGLSEADAEFVVNNALPPYPEQRAGDAFYVAGQTADGHYIQVVYIFSPPGVVFVIHARPLTDREKRRYRRRRK